MRSGDETACRNYAMDMGMMLQLLVPGVQHAEEADIGSEVFRVARDFEQCCGAGAEQQVVDDPLVLQCQRSQFVRQGEDDMHIGRGQEFARPGLKPALARVPLAPRTMPVATRVVRDGAMSATRALIDVTAQRGGAAACDGGQHFQMQPVQPVSDCGR